MAADASRAEFEPLVTETGVSVRNTAPVGRSARTDRAFRRAGIAVAAALMLQACATAGGDAPVATTGPAAQPVELSDPLEPLNRAVFSANTFLDGLIIKPVALLYRQMVPPPIRTVIGNFLVNLSLPLVFINDVAQGEPQRAADTAGRFMLNSIAGVGGLIDVATDAGVPAAHDEDFDQTFAVWGIGPGPYIVLPILGPSTLRHTVGRGASSFADPVSYAIDDSDVMLGLTIANGIVAREGAIEALDDLQRSSVDFYAAVRSAYWQRRLNLIANGKTTSGRQNDDVFRLDLDAE